MIRDWACKEYGIDPAKIVRPFYPGGDYEHYDYPEGAVVLDNPPFSILTKICTFYLDRKIPFFLFAPSLTCFAGTKIFDRMCHSLTTGNGQKRSDRVDGKELLQELLRRYPDQRVSEDPAGAGMLSSLGAQQPEPDDRNEPAGDERQRPGRTAGTRAQAIGPEEIAKAGETLQKYKAGKASLDKRIMDNELWFRMGHWKNCENKMMEGKPKPSSGWLFNSIANKHADAMDNYPEPNVLPRAADDEETAKALSKIIPVVLEQCDYEQVYSDTWWRKLKTGTGVKGVFWDPTLRGGLGDISVKSVNLLMLYWAPGVSDIQESPNLFSLSLEDNEQLVAKYPQLEGHTGKSLDVAEYIHDDQLDTTGKSVVVDWYYKKARPQGAPVLHYCKYCNGVVLYASENDPALAERGFYDHGKYPFVFDPLFMEEDSPAGFGYIDVMKDTQTAIDEMNHAMDENVKLASKLRFVVSDSAGVSEEELADFSRDIVHVVGRLNSDTFMPLQTSVLSGNCITYRDDRVNELKEVSGNRDVSQGGTTSGLTAASAIAALQEAGSKLSRDMLKSAYRSFAKECYLIIELMRQFYDEQRVFRVTGETGQTEYTPFSAAQLRAVPGGEIGGVQLGDHEPVFDITVSAAKKSTFSRLSQNETAKECYQMGFFAPANADAALAALDMMDFEGIEKVRQRVSENGTLYQQLQQMAQQMQKMAAIIDQQNGTNVSEAAGAAAQAAGSTGGGSGSSNVTRSTTNSLGAAVGEGNNSLSTQAAKRAMNANNPNKE